MRVLIIDANPVSSGWLASRLDPHGFTPRCVASPLDALNIEDRASTAAIILDSDSFGKEAAELVHFLRNGGMDQPLTVISSDADWQQRIETLDAGADECMAKPIRSEEIASRLRVQIRRASGNVTDRIESGDLLLDIRARCAWRGSQCLNLTRSEFRLLRAFMLRPGHTHEPAEIWDILNSARDSFSHNAVEVLVARLRRKVGHERIRTVRGLGYRFNLAEL